MRRRPGEMFRNRYPQTPGKYLSACRPDAALKMLKQDLEEANGQAFCSALLKAVLCSLSLTAQETPEPEKAGLVTEIQAFVQENRNRNLTNEEVAKRFSYHPFYLNSLFLEGTGQTLHKYIVSARFSYIKEMLSLSGRPVSEIAQLCGFCDSSYFCAFFKRASGMTPKQYRSLTK